jgi:hypothetical protein
MIDIAKVKGFVWYDASCGLVYYQNGRDVFAAWEGNAVDANTGYLQGRWECSIAHWNRYAPQFQRPSIGRASNDVENQLI